MPDAATNTDRATLYRSPSTWIDRGAFNERRKAARESLSLALDSLATAGGTDDATEAADELAAAQAHLDAARDEIEAAFRGIDS